MGVDVPKTIKVVTKSELVALTRTAFALHLGASRNPEWLTEHVADSSDVALWAILRESHPQPSYRCLVHVQRETFLLDLLIRDYENLPELGGERLVQLTRWALSYVPISPLPAS